MVAGSPRRSSLRFLSWELVERTLDALHQSFQDFDPRESLVVRFYERPSRNFRGRPLDHVGSRRLVCLPLLAVAPVLWSDLETLEARVLARLEPAELLVLRDLHPELH